MQICNPKSPNNCRFAIDINDIYYYTEYVYEENNEILGCIFALCKISGSKEEIYINEMAVLPERQGHGISKQLLNAVKDYSKEKGLAGIVLYTSEHAPAAKFYEKNGFKLSNGTICMYSNN